LERIIGTTAQTHSAFAVHPVSGDIAYPAGSIVIIYHPKKNRQTRFFSGPGNKPFSVVAFSRDGNYLLAGEV